MFWIVVFERERYQTKDSVRLDVEAASEIPMSCCMCEPMETAQSLGDDTHAVVTRPKWA